MRAGMVLFGGLVVASFASPAFAQDPAAAPAAAPEEVVVDTKKVHSPKFALWIGPRISYTGFGFEFYRNVDGSKETTGNLVGTGVSPEIDLGARLFYHYTPYVFFEHGFMKPGHRFDGESDASASTDYYGVGFRYLSNHGDYASFLSDVGVGRRVITLSNHGETFTMSGIELLRLNVGAEIRLSTLLTIEPTLGFSGGKLTSTSGSVTFAKTDSNITAPPFKNGQHIDDSRAYVTMSIGVGGHFDLFGK